MGFSIAVPEVAVFELYANGVIEAQGASLACGVFVVERAAGVTPVAQGQKIVV